MHFPLASRFIGLLIVTVCATSPLKQDHHQVAYLHKQDPKLLTRRETPQSPPPEEITVASEMYKACMHFTTLNHAITYSNAPEQAPSNEEEDIRELDKIHFYCVLKTGKETGHYPTETFDKARWDERIDQLIKLTGRGSRRDIWRENQRRRQAESESGSNGPSDHDIHQNPTNKATFHSKNIHPFSRSDTVKGRVMGGLQRFSSALGSVASKYNNGGGSITMPMPASYPIPKEFTPI